MSERIVREVERLYRWLDDEIRAAVDPRRDCHACGRCCDFPGYDHRLYVTSPEMLYFLERSGQVPLRAMTSGTCPYLEQGRCTVHAHRFVGCRIFGCRRSEDLHSRLTETALKRLKTLCEREGLPYRYTDLAAALNEGGPELDETVAESPAGSTD
jgi:Fe-S-cluster containining protein